MAHPASFPPPSVGPPATRPARATPDLVLALGGADRLRLSAAGLALEHRRHMQAPLELTLGEVRVAVVDPGPAKVSGPCGRFAVLRQMGPRAVVPREEGIEGWLWTSTGGSGLAALGDSGEAPNAALLFTRQLDEARLRAAFDPGFLSALAARSPLGSPAMHGVLFRVEDARAAESALRRWGFESVLTDREVPPTLRRHLPDDKPADPVIHGADVDRAATSVAPPGMG